MRSDTDVRKKISRRRYLHAMVASGLVGFAGCAGNDGGSSSPPGRRPGSDAVTVVVNNVAEQSNVNPWQTTNKSTGINWMTEIKAPTDRQEEPYLSGHTWDAPWIDGTKKISIPTMIKDVEIKPPYDIYETHDDRLTYWDGTPIDANARELHDYIQWCYDGNRFNKTATFNNEAVSQWKYHRWNDKGTVKGQEPNPANDYILRGNAFPDYFVPFHPDFTKPYVEKLKDATTKNEVEDIIKELNGDNVTFFKLADKGWGSGLYRIESSEDISAERAIAKKRDDHPNKHATIPELHIKFATASRRQVLINRGDIDIGGGIVKKEGGKQSRQSLPDNIQEIDRYFQNGGDQILFNWNNDHLGRLWVRRAIVAAVDWNAVGSNGWGPERSNPIKYQTGLLNTISEKTFSKEFLESLYKYPNKSDMKLATEWMKSGGYTKRGGVWTSPEGDKIDLTLKYVSAIKDYVGAAQTIKANLDEFGINVRLQGVNWSTYTKILKPNNTNFDIAIFWAGFSNFWDKYWTDGHWSTNTLVDGDPNDEPPFEVDATDHGDQSHDTVDTQGKPLEVQIPKDVGFIAAPPKAGRNPTLSNGVSIDLADLVHSFREPDASKQASIEQAKKCARYYNYYLPDFIFHQYYWGVWGNVQKLTFPPRGHKANIVSKDFSADDYLVLGGIVQPNSSGEYDPPNNPERKQ